MTRKDKVDGTIRGQSKPIDAATGLLWRNPANFAEVFSKTALRGLTIDPSDLVDQDATEATLLKVMEGAHITLKQSRDVVKGIRNSGEVLAIVGIENQSLIDYLMPFRTLTLDFINLARQVSVIQKRHSDEIKNHEIPDQTTADEIIGRFNKADKLNPVITLVIYYGDKEWDGPRDLADLYKDSPIAPYAARYPMHLLDVRRMSDEQISEFSPSLRAFFGFLKYEKTDKLTAYVRENVDSFGDLSEEALDALIELTRSPELEQFRQTRQNEPGGVNMVYGIEVYANEKAKEASRRTFVETAQYFGQTLSATIKGFIEKFDESPEDAEKDVAKYWKEA